MINRILIRIKVVQMLYSYLLTCTDFRMYTEPKGSSRDQKYAFSLYLDLLLLILRLSGHTVSAAGSQPRPIAVDKKLAANKLVKALAQDSDLRAIINKGSTNIDDYDPIVQHLLDAVQSSAVFADWRKRRSPSLAEDVKLWSTVLHTIIKKDRQALQVMRANPDYTVAGMEQALDMVDETLESFNDVKTSLQQARHDLKRSLEQAYNLYISIFALMIKLTDARAQQIEAAKAKHLATPEDLNPNTKFIDNALIARLRQNPDIQECLEKRVAWQNDPVFIRHLLKLILESDVYSGYMRNPHRSFQADCDFWRELLKNVIFDSEELAEALENESVFWNDDLPIMSTFVLKTIKQMSLEDPDSAPSVGLLPPFKDEEDEHFGDELFMYSVESRDKYREYIDRFISDQWDSERLAFMDIVVMIAAIAEFIHYPAIPVAVTMNEYIEIANAYSTQRSGQFVNGMLYSIVNSLNEEGVINKQV